VEKSKDVIEWRNIIEIKDEDKESSSSLMSMYNLDSDKEYLGVPSHRSPTIIIHDAPLPMHLEEGHNSPLTKKILFERDSVI
jgi:hypothetical protein